MNDLGLIAGIISALIAVGGVIYTSRKGTQSTKESVGAQLIEEALTQMRATINAQGLTLEAHGKQIEDLKIQLAARDRVVRSAVIFIDRVGLWLASGMKGRKPHPDDTLKDHVDVALWEETPPFQGDIPSLM